MSQEIRLYSGIYSWNVETIMDAIDSVKGDIFMRINSPGGSVFDGWGMLAKINEAKAKGKKVKMQVDGLAASFAAFSLLYADSVSSLDVTKVMFHRADMYVRNPEDQALLDTINQDLKDKMLKKFNNDTFKLITGTSIDEMFDPKKRIDVWINAKQAKLLGLIQEIIPTDPTDPIVEKNTQMMQNHMVSMGWEGLVISNDILAQANQDNKSTVNNNTNLNQTKKTMTLDELKQNHPSIFAEAVNIGVAQEFDRVNACMAFAEVDLAGVKAAIESKKALTQSQIIDFMEKKVSATMLAAHAKTNEKPVAPEETKITAEQAEKTAAEKEFEEFFKVSQELALKRLHVK